MSRSPKTRRGKRSSDTFMKEQERVENAEVEVDPRACIEYSIPSFHLMKALLIQHQDLDTPVQHRTKKINTSYPTQSIHKTTIAQLLVSRKDSNFKILTFVVARSIFEICVKYSSPMSRKMEILKDLNRVSTYNFSVEPLRKLQTEFAFAGAGGTGNNNDSLLLLIRGGGAAGSGKEPTPAEAAA